MESGASSTLDIAKMISTDIITGRWIMASTCVCILSAERRAEMERLTVKGPSGLISLKNKSENGANQAIKCLSEYEDTDLTPDEVKELAERDTAKAPIKDTDSGVRYTDDYICPNCGKHFTGTRIAKFCYHCGRRIKWYE